MKLLTFLYSGQKHAGVLVEGGVVPILDINSKHRERIPNNVLEIIQEGMQGDSGEWRSADSARQVTPLLPYDVPPKIWCIGLNYKSHAEDINAVQPEEPGSFMKPASCMFQPGGRNRAAAARKFPTTWMPKANWASSSAGPAASCRAEKVRDVIFGYTTTLDLTALDVLRKNPRYLTRAKSIDTFFSFGPVIVTADEVPGRGRARSDHGAQRRHLLARFRPQHAHAALELVAFPQRLHDALSRAT